MRRFRRLNRIYARVCGYFWTSCPICGEMFGGHESGTQSVLIPPKRYIAGLGDPGDVEVTSFAPERRKIACWRHG